jgi:hypothetical protein
MAKPKKISPEMRALLASMWLHTVGAGKSERRVHGFTLRRNFTVTTVRALINRDLIDYTIDTHNSFSLAQFGLTEAGRAAGKIAYEELERMRVWFPLLR